MHFCSVARVWGVQKVIPWGSSTAGNVCPCSSLPLPKRPAVVVLLLAVPMSVLTNGWALVRLTIDNWQLTMKNKTLMICIGGLSISEWEQTVEIGIDTVGNGLESLGVVAELASVAIDDEQWSSIRLYPLFVQVVEALQVVNLD